MKKIAVVMILGVMVLGLSVVATAAMGVRLRANIPFPFYAGPELMPAGDYIFDIQSVGTGAPTASSILIHNESGSVAKWVLTIPGVIDSGAENHLHFNHYGNRHFLARVEGVGHQANLRLTPAEKELRAQKVAGKDAMIAAAR